MIKKYLTLIILALTVVISTNAQIVKTEDLEKYAKEKYGDTWKKAAKNLKEKELLSLDKNGALTYTQVINCEGMSKDQIYVILNYWYANSFVDANSVIQLNDKELGCIIGQGYVENIANHTGAINSYSISIQPIIKTDIKEGKARVTYTVPFYSVIKIVGSGRAITMMTATAQSLDSKSPAPRITREEQKWTLDECFPFTEDDDHKKTSAKALVMSHAYSNVIMDKIEEALKNGIVGNEGDDW